MSNPLLLQNAEQYIRQLFAARVEETFSYHSIGHTEGVVKAATLMADHYQLPEDERLILLLSAWFHDSGYSKGKAQDHEAASQRIATIISQRLGTRRLSSTGGAAPACGASAS